MNRRFQARKFDAFIEVRCPCGYVHTLLRNEVLEGLSVKRWKCAACKRRFVVACTPGETGCHDEFWPIILDQVPPSGTTIEDGVSISDLNPSDLPDEIHFKCRCGCPLIGKAPMLGRPCRCPRCSSGIVLRIGYRNGTRVPFPILDYSDADGGMPAGGVGA